jgi:hypothetical protein
MTRPVLATKRTSVMAITVSTERLRSSGPSPGATLMLNRHSPRSTSLVSSRIWVMTKRNRWEEKLMMILVAGPYRSGTGDDPVMLAANVQAMNTAALRLFRAGHLPVTGEALALPLTHVAGSERVGDAIFDEIFHPIAQRLLSHCDAILRIGGPSAGADDMVRQARIMGKRVFAAIEDVPVARSDQ